MVVEKGRIISVEYSIYDGEGNSIDSNQGYAPLSFLHGASQVVHGLERALEGMAIHDTKEVILTPENAYGNLKAELIVRLLRKDLASQEPLAEGDLVQLADGNEGEVVSLDDAQVIVDCNHPLAGKTLVYNVTIIAIREASGEERILGYPQPAGFYCGGPGCC